MAKYTAIEDEATYGRELEVIVGRERAGYGAWYEVFPRSCSPDPSCEEGEHSAIAKRGFAIHRQNRF